MMPRVNVDEPWLMERAYEVLRTGVPSQPMLGLKTAYLLQVGYGYLLAPWMAAFGVGLFQARLFNVVLGLGTVLLVAGIGRRTVTPLAGIAAAALLAVDSNFLGGDDKWELAIRSLENALKRRELPYKTIPGEAAFYGPKIDIKLVDAIGRPWQLSTVQFDFNLPD